MLDDLEKKHPLCAYVCDNCFLVQLPEFEKPESIFEDYAYFSSIQVHGYNMQKIM
ncbi:MAG: hypothetical protein JW390_60120 [Nitrosopumilus sp.]|nr:hypothetical protein [Candidatus Nitrosopumilus limneticus]